jgi:site-specific DNA recombinase
MEQFGRSGQWHPDRLARNSMDGGRIIYLVDTGAIRELRFPTFRFDPTAQGKFMLSIAFSQSKYYVDNLSENIKRGIRQKLRNGIWPQWAPLGYLNDRANRCIVVDERKAPLVRKAFEMYATGNYPLADVRKAVNALGLTGRRELTLAIRNYHEMLKNPVYIGMIRFGGELHEGKHEPIITKRLFDQVQAVMRNRSKPKSSGLKPYRYRGFFRCGECGCFITTERQKGNNYLRCTKRKGPCTQRYVREDSMDHQVLAAVRTVVVPAEWTERMHAAIAAETTEQREATEATKSRLAGELAQCEARLDALLDLRLSNEISHEEYAPKKANLLRRKTELREELARMGSKSVRRFEPLTEFVNELNRAVFLTKRENFEGCREFLKKHGSNFQMTDGRLSLVFKNPWKLVLNHHLEPVAPSQHAPDSCRAVKWRRGRDSNSRWGLATHAFQACALNHSATSPPGGRR